MLNVVSSTALIQSAPPSMDHLGIVSDRGLLSWFSSYARETLSLQQFLSNSLHFLSLPSLNIYSSVIAATSTSSVLDAMKLMSEQGVSSVAVLEDETGTLLSGVSVTDIGKVGCESTEEILCFTLT
jgi:CBS domain-containing protein